MRDPTPDLQAEDLLVHAGWVRALARSLTAGQDVDDAVQASWLAAIERPPALRVSIRAWLRSVVRHAVFRSSRRDRIRARAECARATHGCAEPADDVVARAEVHRRLVDRVMALTEPARTTILLHYFEGRTFAEIARRDGIPEATVRSRHHRALQDLRGRLKPEGDGRARRDAIGAGVLIMTTKAKLSIAAGVLVAIAIVGAGLWKRPWGGGEVGSRHGGAASPGTQSADPVVAPAGEEQAASARGIVPKPFGELETLVLAGRVRSESGGAIENARVIAVPYDLATTTDIGTPDNESGWPRVVITGADGGFRIPIRRGAAAFSLVAEAAAHAPGTITVWPDQTQKPVEIVLRPGATIAGIVRELDATPLPGARLALGWVLGGVSIRRTSASGAGGRYRIENVPWDPEPWRSALEASADGHAPVTITILPGADASGTIAKDVYLPRGATIEGTVLDADSGAPIAEARVVLWTNQDLAHLVKPDGTPLRNPNEIRVFRDGAARADGTFRIEHVPSWGVHPAGTGRRYPNEQVLGGVAAHAPGHVPAVIGLEVPDEGATVRVTIRCKPAVRVLGRVVDPDGAPIAGARVWRSADADEHMDGWLPDRVFDALPANQATTDADGRYVLAAVPSSTRASATVMLSAYGNGWPQRQTAVTSLQVMGTGDVRAPDIVLAPDFARSVIVDVRTEDAAPVWGAAIGWVSPDGGVGAPFARTNAAGRALIALPSLPDTTAGWRLQASAAGFAPSSADLVPQEDAPAHVALVLRKGHALSGVVIHPDGSTPRVVTVQVAPAIRPLAEVLSAAESRGSLEPEYASVRAGRDGTFEVRDLPEGPYHVWAHSWEEDAEETAALGDVPTDAKDLRIVVARPVPTPRGGLVVICTDKASREPVLRCHVAMEQDDHAQTPSASAPGEFRFENLKAGRWELVIRAPGYLTFEKTVEIDPKEKVTTMTVGLERGVTFRGRLLHPEGKPFKKPSVDVIGSQQTARISADGAIEVLGLEPGRKIGFVIDDRIRPDASLTYVTKRSDFVTVPSDRAEFSAEIPVWSGGWLTVHIVCDRLFGPNARDAAHRDLAARSRLEIRDLEGQVVLSSTGVHDNVAMVLASGRYHVRLEVPGLPPKDQPVTITGSGEASVTIKVE